MKVSVYILTIGFLILSSCKNPEIILDGYWHGSVTIKGDTFPQMAYFYGRECILNNVDQDSFSYEIDGNHIRFFPKLPGDTFSLNYILFKDSLILSRTEPTRLDIHFRKVSSGLINKLITDSGTDITLPSYFAEKESIFDLCYPLDSYLFVDKTERNISIKHNNRSIILDSSAYKIIRQNSEYGISSRKSFFVFIDKNINKNQLDLVFWNLKLASIYKPKLILHNSKHDSFHYLPQRLNPFSSNDIIKLPTDIADKLGSLPPRPPDILSNKDLVTQLPFFHVTKDSFKDLVNGLDSLSKERLKDRIINKISRPIFLVYYDNDISYEHYVKFNTKLYSIIKDIRENSSLERYQKEYHLLNSEEKSNIDSEFPFFIRELDESELNRVNTCYNNVS